MATDNIRVKSEELQEIIGLRHEAGNPSTQVDVPRYPKTTIIQRTKTVKRSEVMEQGSELIQKLYDRQYKADISEEMNAWLDEHKVKVLTGEVKDRVFVWGLQHGSKIKAWVHQAPDDLEEYTYTYEEEVPQSLIVRRDILNRPLQEIRLVAAELNEGSQRRVMRPVRRLENGIDWLDWHERQRHAEREEATEEQKRVRDDFVEATAKLTTSYGDFKASTSKLNDLLLKADNFLLAVHPKDDGPSKKRRIEELSTKDEKAEQASIKQEKIEQPSDRRDRIIKDVQVLVDTLTFRLPMNRAVFTQLEMVLKHLDVDVVSGIDYNRERCIARRTERINAILGSEDETTT
ncbi:hypothetical protein QQZ08_010504 [Neonectria magnoliae]|uniref:Uncharacterized protein n=1 Tax=Neonectria magnoliae TaxID=2732573 RepID=A0ABR1HHJ0_9HYPO